MIRIVQRGDFKKTERFFRKALRKDYLTILEKYAAEGVAALSSSTPVRTGKTASSWGYEIKRTRNGATIYWTNSNIVNGVPIAVILQFGHGTNGGGYVQGLDYINPAMRPIFDKIAEQAWKEVTS